jgi:hypothetical protein
MRGFSRFWNPAYAGFEVHCDWPGHGEGKRPRGESRPDFASFQWSGFGESGQFGVRRPLRFLAFKLGLREDQVAALARILDDLKTERAQAAVDDRRVLASFADAVAGGAFDEGRANEGVALRRTSADRVAAAVASALPRIHALLDAEQRERFSYLIRTGTITL